MIKLELELSDEELLIFGSMMSSYYDEGPLGSEWKSDKVDKFVAKVENSLTEAVSKKKPVRRRLLEQFKDY